MQARWLRLTVRDRRTPPTKTQKLSRRLLRNDRCPCRASRRAAVTSLFIRTPIRSQTNRKFYAPASLLPENVVYRGEWGRFNRILHDIVAQMGGSISAEHGIGLIKRDELLRYKDPVAIDLMRTLKRALDPQNILNPGKVVAVMEGAPPALPLR